MDVIAQWHRVARDLLPRTAEVLDAHTHTGTNDPDGVVGTAERLIAKLDGAGHEGAVVTTSQDPAGYRAANDRVLAESLASGRRLIPFARVDPREGHSAVSEAIRALDAGHRGIKLHPRAERFRLDDPTVRRVAAVAAERAVPVLVHAGRGIPALGEDVVRLLSDQPGLRLILAHAGLSDLAWLGPVAFEHPGLYFDTAWWDITDLLALFSWVPAARIVYASDTPYGHPELGFTLTMRAAAAAGYRSDELRQLFGGSMSRILSGAPEPAVLAASDRRVSSPDPGLVRVHASLHGAIELAFARADMSEAVEVARLGCAVPDSAPHAPTYHAIRASLDLIDFQAEGRRHVVRPLIVLAAAAMTPGIALPGNIIRHREGP